MKQLGLSDFLELKARRENLDKIEMKENVATDGLRGNIELIYRHCPDFAKKELQEAFNCVEPYDIVLKIFDSNIGEIGDFSNYIFSLYGLGKYEENKENEIGDGIKNS